MAVSGYNIAAIPAGLDSHTSSCSVAMTTWKHCERMVAKLLGGERTGCNGESRRDVEDHRWSVEGKHRKTLPEWLHSAMRQAELEAEHCILNFFLRFCI